MVDFFSRLFDTSGFPARWHCGDWTQFHGWLYILSDLAIFAAYAAIPLSIAYFVFVKRHQLVFQNLYWFFAAFILSCGLTHLLDAIVFWHPVYRIAALVKLFTAIASWATIFAMVRSLPSALALPGIMQLNTDLQHEVDERKRSEAALRASSTRLTLAMLHSGLGDWSWDPRTDLTTFSARSSEIFGMVPGRVEPWTQIASCLHPDDLERVRQAVTNSVESKGDYDIEYRVIRPTDGREIWVSAKGHGDYDSDGKITNMFGTVQDITERKIAEHQREETLLLERNARIEAERAGLMKDEFLATLSHELRTPLNAILGWTQLLKESDDNEQLQEGLSVIERNTRLQSQLVNDLLDMNRIITGKVRLDLQQVDLAELILAALDGIRPSAQAKKIQIETRFQPVTESIQGDPTRLQQIIWNLLNNAIKFTPTDGRVVINLRDAENGVEIVVSDSGIGISAEFLPYVFNRFRQADSSTTRKHGGLGLGLAIVRSLTEVHGGNVSVESAGENQGTSFRLWLPAAKNQSTASEANPETPARGSTSDAAAHWPRLSGIRILVVENDRDSLTLIQRVLAKQGALVQIAESGLEGLAALKNHHFDLLVSDIGMPEMDGFALIEALRELPAGQNGRIPAVALTAFVRSEDKRRAIEAGYDVFISKPVEPLNFLQLIDFHTSQRGISSIP